MKMPENISMYINLYINLEFGSLERSTPTKAIQAHKVHRITEQRDEIEFCQRKRMTRCVSFKVYLAWRAPDGNAIELPATATLTNVHPHRFAQPTLQLTRYFSSTFYLHPCTYFQCATNNRKLNTPRYSIDIARKCKAYCIIQRLKLTFRSIYRRR